MPRALPWLTKASSAAHGAETSPIARSAKQSEPPATSRTSARGTVDSTATGLTSLVRDFRVRGSGAHLSSPQSCEYKPQEIRPGFAADDGWMMVEDELLDTAKLYTRHLHRAEYERLKRVVAENKHARRETDLGTMAGSTFLRPILTRGTGSASESPSEAVDDVRVKGLERLMGGRRGRTTLLSRTVDRRTDASRGRTCQTLSVPEEGDEGVGSPFESENDDLDHAARKKSSVLETRHSHAGTHNSQAVGDHCISIEERTTSERSERSVTSTHTKRRAVFREPVRPRPPAPTKDKKEDRDGHMMKPSTPRPSVKSQMLDRGRSSSEDEGSKQMKAILARRRAAKNKTKVDTTAAVDLDGIPTFRFN